MKEAPQPETKTTSEEPLCSESDPEYEADNQGLDPLLISVLGDSESVNIYKIIESNFIKELEAEGFTIEESLDIAKDSDVSSLFVEGTKSIHEGFSSPVKILQEDSFSQEAGHDEQINRAKFEEFCALLSKEKSSDPAKDAFEAMLLNTILQKDESGNNEFMEKMLPGCARRIDQVLKQQKDLNQWIEVNSKIGKTPEFVAQMDDWLYQKIEKLESVVESIFLLAAQYPNLVNGFFGILNFGWWASNLTPIGLLTKVGGQLAWSGIGAALDASGSKEALAARLKGLGLVKAGDKLAGILFKLGKTFLGGKAAKISTKSIARAGAVVERARKGRSHFAENAAQAVRESRGKILIPIKDKMEAISGRKMPEIQKQELRRLLIEKEWNYIGKEGANNLRRDFEKISDKLIAEWEHKTGQIWPKYSETLRNLHGKEIQKAGARWQAHHIIPLGRGGPNTWQNIHPMPKGQHQSFHHQMEAIFRGHKK